MQNTTLLADSTLNIDIALKDYTHAIQTAVNSSAYKKPTNHKLYSVPPEISLEIEQKNRLRREWQRSRDPAIKLRLNNKIAYIHLMLQIHR